jgi:hypothetical protein
MALSKVEAANVNHTANEPKAAAPLVAVNKLQAARL